MASGSTTSTGSATRPRTSARLRDAVGPDVLLVVEKILTGDEALPDWPVQGTTGYEALATIGRVLVDADGAESLRSAYVEFAERPDHYAVVAEDKRRLVLRSVLASDVERLTALLVQICAHRRQSRDFTRVELREALREVLTHAPTYRSYVAIREDGVERTLNDLNFVDLAIARARDARADLDGDLFDLLRAILLGELGLPEAVELALRVQQLSGSVVAKGDEDAAHYSWGPLLSVNEVGSDPDHPSIVSRRLPRCDAPARRAPVGRHGHHGDPRHEAQRGRSGSPCRAVRGSRPMDPLGAAVVGDVGTVA